MRKLAWFSGGFGAACLIFCYAPDSLPCIGAAALLLFGALLCWRLFRPYRGAEPALLPRRRRSFAYAVRRCCALCLGAALALLWSALYARLFYAPAQELAGTEQVICGEVTSCPEPTSVGGWSMTVRLEGDFRSPDVLLYGGEEWGDLRPGDRVSCTARLTASDFAYGDETTYYTARGLFLLAYCRQAPVVERAQRTALRHWPTVCAEALERGIRAAFDEVAAPLAAAVTLGRKDALSQQSYTALNRSGIMHAAVVSGMHISFLVSVLLLLCGRRRRVAVCLIPVLVFYAFMAGATPSAFRAVIMQTALLAAPVLGRENDPPSSLGLALLILLLQNPYAAASVSLQLSFASVAGILLFSRRISSFLFSCARRRLRRTSRLGRLLLRGARLLSASVATTLGAMAFTTGLIALYFGQIGLAAPLTNLLTLWAITALMVCALLLGTVGVFLPNAVQLPGRIAGLTGHFVHAVTDVIGRWPLACLPAEEPNFLICLAAAYLFALTIALARRKGRQTLFCLLCLTLLLTASVGMNRRAVSQSELTLTALDVGQGASTLFLCGDSAVIVDCGGNSRSDPGDLAADRLAALGRVGLDALVFTHLDSDHFNGAEQLFWRLEIRRVYLPLSAAHEENLARLLALAEREGAEVIFVTETVTFSAGSAAFTLYPPLGGGSANEEGLFVLCSAGDFDVLITGDADSFTERMLLKYHALPDIELLIAGHHGSNRSTSQELLDALRPELAILSVGRNSYGHPAEEVLSRLADAGAQVMRTDLSGTLTLRVRGGQVSLP